MCILVDIWLPNVYKIMYLDPFLPPFGETPKLGVKYPIAMCTKKTCFGTDLLYWELSRVHNAVHEYPEKG
jgi:hypothetical protein